MSLNFVVLLMKLGITYYNVYGSCCKWWHGVKLWEAIFGTMESEFAHCGFAFREFFVMLIFVFFNVSWNNAYRLGNFKTQLH